jgi:nitroreductase
MNDAIIEAIKQRSSTNIFDASRGITDERIGELISLATLAPTAFNLQNWRFIAVRTEAEKIRLRKLAYDQAKVSDAAVTFIVCGQLAEHSVMAERLAPSVEAGLMPAEMVAGWEGAAKGLYFGKPQTQRDEAIRTATFGAGALISAAQAYNLSSSAMIGFDPDAVAREFELAADEVPVMLLAVGFAAENNWPQKPRRPLSQVLTLV